VNGKGYSPPKKQVIEFGAVNSVVNRVECSILVSLCNIPEDARRSIVFRPGRDGEEGISTSRVACLPDANRKKWR